MTNMSYRLNANVVRAAAPPVAVAHSWIAGLTFPAQRPLLDVAQAAPSYPPAGPLREFLARRAMEPTTSSYSEIAGLPALRNAFAAHLAREYGARLDGERILITAGCNQAFCSVVTALAAPGDEVVLPLPYYFNHQMWLEMQGIRPVHVPFDEARSGVPDIDAFERALTARSRAIAVVSPNNPTGAIYPASLLAALYALARQAGVALIVDETYKDFRGPRGPAHRLFAEPDWSGTFVQLYSFSKAFSLAGYRVGAVTCGPTLRAALLKLQDCITICAPRLGQEAALFGLEQLDEWRENNRRLMDERVAAVKRIFSDPRLRYRLVSIGAYFAYVKHPFGAESSHTVAKRLAEAHGLLCLPGTMFGPGQESFLRIAFANLEAEMAPRLLERLLESQGPATASHASPSP